MVTIPKIIIVLFAVQLLSCNIHPVDSTSKTTPLITKDTTNKNERDNKLFVFVGEKIDFTPIPYEPGDFDEGIVAKYKILQHVYGYYDKDTIVFEAYDHYGTPTFTEYKTVLLFVSEYEGKFYHEKYQYDPLFITKDGRWAGPYSDDYYHSYNENTTVKPQRINFAEEVSFPTKLKDDEGKEYSVTYPEPYFKIKGDKAIAVYGNYVKELFQLKKDGVLTARELFGDKKKELKVNEIKLKDIPDTTIKK
jgi:hypothetical protein